MRLFEAILQANQRHIAGERDARVDLAQFEAALPIAALTCIDVRLNHLLPDVLGVPEEKFIWLRNAGNIITSPLSSTMRSLALACAVKGAKEITVIGHSDCQVCRTGAMQLLDKLAAIGVDRDKLPENLVEYFGLFASERQNVIRGVELVRSSPLIGAKVPVHGLLLDVTSGRVEWVVNGYENFGAVAALPGKAGELFGKAENALGKLDRIGHVASEELQLPDSKIGEIVSTAQSMLQRAERIAKAANQAAAPKAAGPSAPAAAEAPAPPIIPSPARVVTPGDKLRLLAKTLRDAKRNSRR